VDLEIAVFPGLGLAVAIERGGMDASWTWMKKLKGWQLDQMVGHVER